MTSPLSPLSTASQPKSKFLAIFGLALVLAGGVSSAALVQITHLPNTLGVPAQNSSAPSVTGTVPIDAVATGYTLTITATATFESNFVQFQAAEVGQTNGGLTVNNPGNVNRFRDNATIYFGMVIKDAGGVDVTALYDIKITNLYAFVDAGQDVLKINVDSGAAIYSFPKAADTGNAAIWAQGTVPQYKIPDPSDVSFLSVGNAGGVLRFNFSGIEMDIVPATEPSSPPAITSITSLGNGNWELTLAGKPDTSYEFYSSPTLDFTPGTLVENLAAGAVPAGTIGGFNSSVLTTDVNGEGTVQMVLSGNPADFVRAQTAPPL